MMGFDVNNQGTSATADLPLSNHKAALPPKPHAVSTPSSKKTAAATNSMSATPISSGTGGYSLYSLIKKQSQNTPAAQKPVLASTMSSVTSPAKTVASCMPAGVLKKPSTVADVTAAKSQTGSATASRAAVSFADVTEKFDAVDKDIKTDYTSPQRSVLRRSIPFFLANDHGFANSMWTNILHQLCFAFYVQSSICYQYPVFSLCFVARFEDVVACFAIITRLLIPSGLCFGNLKNYHFYVLFILALFRKCSLFRCTCPILSGMLCRITCHP